MSDEARRLDDLRDRVVVLIREQTGLHEQFAVPIAAKIVDVVRREVITQVVGAVSGERVYVPARDPEIATKVVAEFNGNNRDELMRKYDISRSTFYAYLQRTRTPSAPAAPLRSPTQRDEFSF